MEGAIATAYPSFTRVTSNPPWPLQEDTSTLDANESISMTTSFKSFVEYQGPDRQFSDFINPLINTFPYDEASGRNKAELNVNYEYLPYMTLAAHTASHYGGANFINFFFDDMQFWQIMEGDYKILNYPWRQSASGNITYEWGPGDVKSFDITMSGESGGILAFSMFDRTDSYLFNHKWEIKFLRLISDHFEITTTPPAIPKITELSHEVQTTATVNPNTNDTAHPFIYTYKLILDYKKQYALEKIRNESTINDPPDPYDVIPVHEILDWYGDPYQDLPQPLPTSYNLFPSLDPTLRVIANIETDQILYPIWGDSGYGFTYKLKVYYRSVGRYLPDGFPSTGFVEQFFSGSGHEDKPNQIPSDFYEQVVFTSPITIKWCGQYADGEYVKDLTYEIQRILIDCSAIGGLNMQTNAAIELIASKTNYPYPLGYQLPI